MIPTFNDILQLLPQDFIEKLRATEQDKLYHPEGNVLNHLEKIYYYLRNRYEADPDLPTLLAIMCIHDAGKIDKTAPRIDRQGRTRISAIGHEMKSLDYILALKECLMKSEYFANVNWAGVSDVTAQHMRMHVYKSQMGDKKRKEMEEQYAHVWELLVKFSRADEHRDAEA